jgi:acyl transferase domain-containing protein/3-hydroxymyristoyl/3-hydroxydecanoyl-(acyl carrier protein) dehydratase
LAITGLAGCFGPWEGLPDLARAFHAGESGRRPLPSQRWRGLDGDGALLARLGLDTGRAPEGGYLSGFAADPLRLRIPPRDLGRINPQHTLMLHVGDAALRDAGIRPGSRVAVLVAMAMENDVHRLAARWSVGRLLPGAPDAVQAAVRDALHPPPEAGDCLGHVGNLIASRIAALWDLSGPAMTVSAGPAGVARALDLARHLLAAGEAEAVLVGAVDLAGGLGNLAVRLASHPEDGRAIPPGEGAGAVVLRPDAPGLSSYAVLPRGGAGGPTGLTEPVDQAADAGTVELLGACGAAGGIAGVIRAALAVANRALPEGAAPRQPWLAPSGAAAASVVIRNRDGVRREVIMRERGRGALPRRADPVGPPFVLPVPARDGPALAAALASVARRLEDGEPAPCLEAEATAGDDGSLPYAACLVGRDAAALAAEARHLMNRAEACLDKGQTQLAPGGSVLCGSPIGPAGRVAFVFPGFDSAYPGLCRDLPLLADGVVEDLARRFAEPARLLPPELLFGRADTPEKAEQAADRLQRAGEWHLQLGPAVAFIGMRVLEERLGLQPDLCFGHSLGELSMLFATGAWTFDQDWLGRLASLRPVLDRLALPAGHGRFLVVAPASDVRAALGSHAELALSNSTRECVVVGPEEACAAALERLGLEWLRLADGFAAHTAAAAALAPALAEHLDAPLACRPGVRFLFGQGEPEADRWTSGDVAARIAAGLSRPFDFAGLVERAHAEGARLFIEVGPGSGCTRWIGDTLGAARRPHLAAPLTRRGVDEPVALAQLAAALVAHRRPVDFANLLRRPTPPPPQAMRVTTGGPSVLAALRSVVPHAAEPPAPVACAAAPRAPAPLPVRPLPAARATGSCVLELAAEQHSWGHLVFLQQRRTLVEALALGGRQAAVVAPAPAASLPPAPKPARVTARTPLLEEAAILELAEGRAHAVFGPDFLPVDAMPRRIRVPGQPFTALTRVLALEGTRGRFDHGRIVTEYDIPDRAWFAVDGISASEIAVDGQGVLILLAWLGADFESRGQRRFRWLDATATVLGAPPREGETVRYDIRLEHSFRDGDNLILQFRNEASVDGRPLLAITDCMVGLFQDAALAASAGILSQHRIARHPGPAFAPPLAPPHGGRLDRAGLLALSAGGPGAAFSPAHAAPHAPALRLPAPPLHMLDEVTAIRTAGGRLGLGGAEAALTLDPTHWAVRAHFKDDPVFPGPCMLEGATQLLKIQALASGLQRGAVPGAHFVPLRGRPRRMRFRAQAVPSGQTFTYRSETVAAGMSPEPFIVADVEFDVEGRTIGRVEDLGLTMTAAVR